MEKLKLTVQQVYVVEAFIYPSNSLSCSSPPLHVSARNRETISRTTPLGVHPTSTSCDGSDQAFPLLLDFFLRFVYVFAGSSLEMRLLIYIILYIAVLLFQLTSEEN